MYPSSEIVKELLEIYQNEDELRAKGLKLWAQHKFAEFESVSKEMDALVQRREALEALARMRNLRLEDI